MERERTMVAISVCNCDTLYRVGTRAVSAKEHDGAFGDLVLALLGTTVRQSCRQVQ